MLICKSQYSTLLGALDPTKERLFNEFKSINAILNADVNHLQNVKGVNERIANEIINLELS